MLEKHMNNINKRLDSTAEHLAKLQKDGEIYFKNLKKIITRSRLNLKEPIQKARVQNNILLASQLRQYCFYFIKSNENIERVNLKSLTKDINKLFKLVSRYETCEKFKLKESVEIMGDKNTYAYVDDKFVVSFVKLTKFEVLKDSILIEMILNEKGEALQLALNSYIDSQEELLSHTTEEVVAVELQCKVTKKIYQSLYSTKLDKLII